MWLLYSRAEGEGKMIKPKRTAAEQVEDEAESQAAPEFQENLKRLKADRLAREADLKARSKGPRSDRVEGK
jgi:hypothetical protein